MADRAVPLSETGGSAVKRYRCILADPPWQYRDRATRGAAERHYRTLSLEDLLALPVADLAEDDAHLWLWVTNQMLADGTAAKVVRAWGFEPKTVVTWAKTTRDGRRPKIGVGHYVRNATEHLVFAVRGRLAVLDRSVPSYFLAPAQVPHSRKPDVSYDLIMRISPGPYLELFATRIWPGWDAMGLAIDGRDIREAIRAHLTGEEAVTSERQQAASPLAIG